MSKESNLQGVTTSEGAGIAGESQRWEPGPLVEDEVLRERVRRLVPQRVNSRPWYSSILRHPLVALVVGFLLTSGVGAYLANWYQDTSDAQRQLAALREARREAAMATFQEVGRKLDRRLFWTGQLYDASSTDTSSDRRKAIAARLDSATWAWRESYHTNAAAVCRYFGPSMSAYMIDSVGAKFSVLGKKVRDRAIEPQLAKRDLYPEYQDLQRAVAELTFRMVEKVRSGVVGDSSSPPCHGQLPQDSVGRGETKARVR